MLAGRVNMRTPQIPVTWFPVGDDGTYLAILPKCGTKSTEYTMFPKTRRPPEKLRAIPPEPTRVITFIRDPIERLQSAFHYFNHRNPSFPHVDGHGTPSELEWDHFVDLMLDHDYWDKHWCPQHWLLVMVGLLETEALVPENFEDYGEVIRRETGLTPVHENKSGVPKERPDYRLEELYERFGGDYELRRGERE